MYQGDSAMSSSEVESIERPIHWANIVEALRTPVRLRQSSSGIWSIRLCWEDPQAPNGQRYMWLYYSRNLRNITRLQDYLKSGFEAFEGQKVTFDKPDPNDVLQETAILCGGDVSISQIVWWRLEGGKQRDYAFYVSDGGSLYEDETDSTLRFILGCTIAHLENPNRFLAYCSEVANLTIERIQDQIEQKKLEILTAYA